MGPVVVVGPIQVNAKTFGVILDDRGPDSELRCSGLSDHGAL
jgi:hypothetical protein